MDLKYMAGFFDGEGCVYLKKSLGKYYLIVAISQKNKPFLEKLKRTFGGKIYPNTKNRDNYLWQICGTNATIFLESIKDFSIIKKEEIELGIIFGKTIIRHRRKGVPPFVINQRELIYQRIKKLKQRTPESFI